MIGQEVYSENILTTAGKYRKQFDANMFSDGVYLIQVVSNRINYTNRLLIRR